MLVLQLLLQTFHPILQNINVRQQAVYPLLLQYCLMVQVRLEFEFVFDRLLQLVFQLFEAGLELLGYHFELVVLLLLVGQSHTELILQTADFAHMHFYLLRVLVLPL